MIDHLIQKIKEDVQYNENKIIGLCYNPENHYYLIINKGFICIADDNITYMSIKNYQFRPTFGGSYL